MDDVRSRHIRDFLHTLLGPVIYVVFFGLSYSAGSIACALSRRSLISDPSSATISGVAVLTAIALLLIAWRAASGMRLLRQTEDGEETFMGFLSLMLAILSAVAVIWTGLPAAVVRATC